MRGSGRGGASRGVLKFAEIGRRLDGMVESVKTKVPPADKPRRPDDWREQIKADLAAQLEAGATLYGVRSDGAYIARTKDGDRVIPMPVD